jgi:hypothetical protein
MLSWPLALRAQAPDVQILKPGAMFQNRTDSTLFVLTRYRLERLVIRSELADSLKVFWQKDREQLLGENLKLQGDVFFWRTVSISAGFVLGIEVLRIVLTK